VGVGVGVVEQLGFKITPATPEQLPPLGLAEPPSLRRLTNLIIIIN